MYDRDKAVSENLGLVHSCAKRFRGRGIEYDDLFQAGCVGLIKAIDNFDESRGLKLSTYAVPVILGEIKGLFRDGGAVKISRGLKELSLKATREVARFLKENGREPQISELAQILGVEPEQATEALNASRLPVSLTADEENGSGQLDIPTDSPDEKLTEVISLHDEIRNLEPNDRNLILLRFFKNKTQSETAKELGMTQVQVSRREKKLLIYLRERLL